MRWFHALGIGALWCASAILNASELIPANVTVGANLQVNAVIKLDEAAPASGLDITLTSSEPARLLFANAPDAAGEPKMVVSVGPGLRQTSDFWIQGFGTSGVATYTAAAPGFGPATGKVTVAPSGIVLAGPFGAAKFPTTSGAMPSRLTARTVLLDQNLKYVEAQPVAGGRNVETTVTISDRSVGVITDAVLTIAGGYGAASTQFQPSAPGIATIAVAAPTGFSVPAEGASVTAVVSAPGLAVTDQVSIGRDLQLGGSLSLGEPAPDSGLVVTLTSANPELLVLSAAPTEQGAGRLELKIPPGAAHGTYYLQALGGAGTIRYTATAPGFRSRTGTVTLTPSGVMITPASYGPPDEGEFLQPDAPVLPPRFVTKMAAGDVRLMVWTAHLDPVTKRGADITVQPLRAGMTLKIHLGNANDAVGRVESPVVIQAGSEHGVVHFKPLSAGSTAISVTTPPSFTTPSNATRVMAFVQP